MQEGDLADVTTARGRVRARVRITGIREGVVFVPFHYGYWDADDPARARAANELTPTAWDPVSKQPLFKTAAAQVTAVAGDEGGVSRAPTTAASAPLDGGGPVTTGGPDAESDDVVLAGERS
ncbi:molybdopterin dinucleotide binding domain-containing protein [Cellulomonas edaphi]|uniref:molybdopterin dinucleotide binding domain-containing protein n=1 Tax=Cellulomonas edaphi TaxID=3053468 RepID=UPI002DD6B204|nr:molybdopterin dinucleotide binding domain-containing protein [Cellulomons edaphi]